MAEHLQVFVNGARVGVGPGTTVAAAVMAAGRHHLRQSVTGEARGALCGMGVCMECRVTVNGEANVKGCQALCLDGMEIMTI